MSRVLILEEDPDLAALFKLLLEDEGFEVAVAGCLEQAETELRAQAPALILVELATDAANKRFLPDLRRSFADLAPFAPALLCTSTPSVTRTSAAVAGFEGYLQMPFDVSDALGEVERVLRMEKVSGKSTNGFCACGGA